MLNDDIIAYLNGKGIAFTGADFQTGIPEGGGDQIMHWDADKLGLQPTADVLAAAGIAAKLANQWAAVRAKRTSELALCDWTQLSDSSADKVAWAVYRQALRDITKQLDPFNITWPEQPK